MFKAYTDGSCLRNPGGNGGLAYLTLDVNDKPLKRYWLGFRATTNNRMELMAAYYALIEAYTQKAADVQIMTDSKYVVDGCNKYIQKWRTNGYKGGTVKNIDLWTGMDFYLSHMRCEFVWVKAHAGIEYHEIVDELAYNAAHQPQYIDTGYEEQPK